MLLLHRERNMGPAEFIGFCKEVEEFCLIWRSVGIHESSRMRRGCE